MPAGASTGTDVGTRMTIIFIQTSLERFLEPSAFKLQNITLICLNYIFGFIVLEFANVVLPPRVFRIVFEEVQTLTVTCKLISKISAIAIEKL